MAIDELRSLFLFAGLSDEQLRQLDDASTTVSFQEGDVLFREGEPAEFWWVLLDGRIELLRRSGHEVSVIGVMDRPGLWAGGFRAWTDSVGYLATARAPGPGRALRVPTAALGEFVRAWFPFSLHLIQGFFQTVRMIDALSRQREALIALGTLAAGLAHELNNPASAATRAVDELQATCDTLLRSLVQVAEGSMSSEQFLALDEMRRGIDPSSASDDPLAVADREEALIGWLDSHDIPRSWEVAPPLALAGVELAWCEQVGQLLDSDSLGAGLEWTASALSMTALLSEIKEATGRVSNLVATVKSYAQLDRASLQDIDVTEGINSTLVILGAKLHDGITVVRDYADDLPRIEAIPGELNQVWTNLIDNAIDAMEGKGTLRLSTRPDGEHVIVEVADTGSGMPPDVQARAFEPFFTTKAVGNGTGLGLDISRRIVVDRHHGEILIASQPGKTVLTVRLPRSRT
ncbi:MAG TPA: ATP-binding protein [Acidimicrobiales bacterium]|nr:ATP-binding protein [Acidimicrobiales bacterium]